ncbi:PAS domain-containing protein [Eleftheria terrae]|uniref:PAS domain-containing protein n=1 Tax=Eleftheria terrae TaxID=1597781 RepID=UPI00263B9071|nr:PAS domain-containing protein [Eleftheria terrae]WKB53602.1 PAS domain-containing protein [Eleftheria terrae]
MPHRINHTALFSLSPNPYMVLDLAWTIVDANQAYLAATGRRRDDIIGRNLFEAFPGNPDDPDDASVVQLRQSLEQAVRERRPHHLALIRYAIASEVDGRTVFRERYWSATHTPVMNEAGQVVAVLQHTVDVTELQTLKKAVRAAEQARRNEIEASVLQRAQAVQAAHRTLDVQHRQLRRLFEQAPGFIAVLRGPLHVFDLVNQAYYQLVGHRDILGKPVREALPEVAGQGFFELLDRVLETGEAFVGRGMRVQVQPEPGGPLQERYVDLVYQPVLEADGSVSGIFAQGHDITEQRRAEEERERYRCRLETLVHERTAALERSQAEHAQTQAQLQHVQKLEALGRLTGGVAHDFNNLLQVIGNSLQLLQRLTAGNATAQRWIDVASNAVANGSKLTGQLLAFARRQPLEPRTVNMGRLVQGMDDLLKRVLGETIELQASAQDGLWNTFADPYQLENVVLNLAINARDAMGEAGRLSIAASNTVLDEDAARRHDVAPGPYVLLSVSDTGSGMPPEVLERAFEPFFSTKPEGVGTGLGLSMVYGFVKQSGGHVQIDSEVGRGTCVRIYLPRATEAEVKPPEPVGGGAVRGGDETILVVEDNPEVLATTVETLSELGYRVLKAHDGQSALAIVQSGLPIDLLFSDVVMPGPLRSHEMARQAQALLPQMRVLFTSGYTEDAIVHGGRLDPGVHLLSKPYRREDLARRIRQLLPTKNGETASA